MWDLHSVRWERLISQTMKHYQNDEISVSNPKEGLKYYVIMGFKGGMLFLFLYDKNLSFLYSLTRNNKKKKIHEGRGTVGILSYVDDVEGIGKKCIFLFSISTNKLNKFRDILFLVTCFMKKSLDFSIIFLLCANLQMYWLKSTFR